MLSYVVIIRSLYPVCCQALKEQCTSLETQIGQQKERVKAAAPDEKALKQLEKTTAEHKKGVCTVVLWYRVRKVIT